MESISKSHWLFLDNPTTSRVFENYHHISSHYHLDVCLLPDLPVPSCALVYSSHKGQSDSLKMAWHSQCQGHDWAWRRVHTHVGTGCGLQINVEAAFRWLQVLSE